MKPLRGFKICGWKFFSIDMNARWAKIFGQYSNHSSFMLLSWGCIENIEGLSSPDVLVNLPLFAY